MCVNRNGEKHKRAEKNRTFQSRLRERERERERERTTQKFKELFGQNLFLFFLLMFASFIKKKGKKKFTEKKKV